MTGGPQMGSLYGSLCICCHLKGHGCNCPHETACLRCGKCRLHCEEQRKVKVRT